MESALGQEYGACNSDSEFLLSPFQNSSARWLDLLADDELIEPWTPANIQLKIHSVRFRRVSDGDLYPDSNTPPKCEIATIGNDQTPLLMDICNVSDKAVTVGVANFNL